MEKSRLSIRVEERCALLNEKIVEIDDTISMLNDSRSNDLLELEKIKSLSNLKELKKEEFEELFRLLE